MIAAVTPPLAPLVALVALLVLLLAAVLGPHFWVRRVLARAGTDRPDLPGTGGELARHLLDKAGLPTVRVEATTEADHYDPWSGSVCLAPAHLDGRSVAATAIAAHEVAHAVQHARDEPAFRRRTDLMGGIAMLDRAAQLVLLSTPAVLFLVQSPTILALQIGLAAALLAGRIAIHAVTLPVEFDASFAKALPTLEAGGYLGPADLPAARRVLRAAALTPIAAALARLLNPLRWIRP